MRFSGGGLPGRGTYGPTILTQQQLEHCLTLEAQINAAAEVVDQEEKALNASHMQIERLGQEISVRASSVNRYSQVSVDGYNRLISQHRSLVGDFNALLPAFNARVEAHNQRIENFNAVCAQRSYYEADLKAARLRLGQN